ncbi:MAG: CPBP family intramembrane metalloprotease [Pseudomonadales bacterium]|nr:CPBP family intramembrane metalloprotease [Pseudomonadales bacterium]
MSSEGSILTAVAIPALGYYVAWALVQQYIIVAYIFPRLNVLVPKYTLVLSAAIFSYLHFPNFSLMNVTFVMGLLWYARYQKYGNWYAIAISHAFLAVVFREIVPEQWRISGEVGLVFLSKLGL